MSICYRNVCMYDCVSVCLFILTKYLSLIYVVVVLIWVTVIVAFAIKLYCLLVDLDYVCVWMIREISKR